MFKVHNAKTLICGNCVSVFYISAACTYSYLPLQVTTQHEQCHLLECFHGSKVFFVMFKIHVSQYR